MHSGARLGHYEIVAAIGRGGMGEVWKARDTKLQRDVAVKTLPAEFAHWPDRLARIEREAKSLAAVNHPNIASIYGLEEHAGTRYLVIELVDGETLAERLCRGPIPLGPALKIALQIAEALEAAHEKGIIHRDLKPANIKVTPEGRVKVLDFGLAKAFSAEAEVATQLTIQGDVPAVIGTPPYMSPEQARGETLGPRTDIWSFGVVLFEMLTGESPFDRGSATQTLARVLEAQPDFALLPAATPASARHLLTRCLEKEQRRRFRDSADVRIELEDALAALGTGPVAPAARARGSSARLRAAALVALVAVVTALATTILLRTFGPPPPDELRLEVAPPPYADPWSFAIAPDGRKLVFVAPAEGQPRLWLRPFDVDESQQLPNTSGASAPFWSPDSRSVGFFADGQLKRIELDGGAVQTLARAVSGSGGTWSDGGRILFSPSRLSPISSIAATGGAVTTVTEVDLMREITHLSPSFLPDGDRFLYYVQSGADARGVYLGGPDGLEPRRLLDADAPAVYASGHLLYVRQAALLAQPFDVARLELVGDPFTVAEGVLADPGRSLTALSAAAAGPIAYRRAADTDRSALTWFDRTGRRLGTLPSTQDSRIWSPAASADGGRVAFYMSLAGNTDVWVLDTARGVSTRFTFDPAFDNSPVWSPDGTAIAFASNRNGAFDLYRKSSVAEGPEELLLQSDFNKIPTDWSADGRYLLYRVTTPSGYDVFVLPLDEGARRPLEIATSRYDEREAQFSPDGRWVAYQSNESGRFEIYLQSFPVPNGKTLISVGGGVQARWGGDGRELFYISLDNRLMTVPLDLGSDRTVRAGSPVELFAPDLADGPVLLVETTQYVVADDGQRFLMNSSDVPSGPITILLNWVPQR